MSTINLSQIRPSTNNGDLIATVSGKVQNLTLNPGPGIFFTLTGTTLTISTTPTFAITAFTGGSVIELGASVSNPTFMAAYSNTPGSAQITNTDGISSPTNLTTPFTAATITGTFAHTAITTTTFTLSATEGSVTETATQTIVWEPAIFGGSGAAGATSAVTASGTTAVLSTSDVLARAQLGAESVGTSFGPYTVSGSSIYLLLMGSAHTFIDANTGLTLPMNAPLTVTFVNVHGVAVTMYLYETVYNVYGTLKPQVTS